MTFLLLRACMRALLAEADNVADVAFEVSATESTISVVGRIPGREKIIAHASAVKLSTQEPDPFGSDDDSWQVLPIDHWHAFDMLRKRLRRPDLGLFGATSSYTDRRMRGEGLGERMYTLLLKAVADHGSALVPNEAYEGPGATSLAAQRVWRKLGGIMHVDSVFWGGHVNVAALPRLRSRRRHGFKKHQRPRSHDARVDDV